MVVVIACGGPSRDDQSFSELNFVAFAEKGQQGREVHVFG